MISYTEFDNLPAMTTELWAQFFGVPPHKILVSTVDKIRTIRRFFEIVEELRESGK